MNKYLLIDTIASKLNKMEQNEVQCVVTSLQFDFNEGMLFQSETGRTRARVTMQLH